MVVLEVQTPRVPHEWRTRADFVRIHLTNWAFLLGDLTRVENGKREVDLSLTLLLV